MQREICPERVSGLRPPSPEEPALLETAVRLLREEMPLSTMAWMSVSAVPQSPKPAERMVLPDWMSATASRAEG